jgi:hypothetical protein
MIYLTIYLCIKGETICIDIVGLQVRAIIVGQTRVIAAIGLRDVITSAAALAAASGLADAAASAKAVRI